MLPNVGEGICQEMSDMLSLLSRSIGFSPALTPTASFLRDFQSSSAATVVIIFEPLFFFFGFPSPSFCCRLQILLPPIGYMLQHILMAKNKLGLISMGD